MVGKKGLQSDGFLRCEHQQSPHQQLEGQSSCGDWNGAQANEKFLSLKEQVWGGSQGQPADQSQQPKPPKYRPPK